jgi:alkylation response protein AidB-like acyl-CoA dehydrogenase
MDLTVSASELAFRDELRAWLHANDPGPEPVGDADAHYHWRVDFQRRLAHDGWAAVHWPVQYGGRGATLTQSAIFFEELGRARAPLPANVLGLLLAGPTIMSWGTQEQKDRYLQPILTAEEIWCQGFSEPDAGSDLAAVKTRAVRDGDGWIVTGQKVWTSGAQYSKWCMLVARTDPDATKHKGLSYFLMDMDQDGVEVRPLRQITGGSEFNELFIDGARVAGENLLGGEGNGWKVALTTLPAGPDASAARPVDRARRRPRVAAGSAGRPAARGAAPQGRGAAPHRLPWVDGHREVRSAGPRRLVDEVDVVADQPGADRARRRPARSGGVEQPQPVGV